MSLKEKLILCGMVAATVIVTLLAWGFIAPRIAHNTAPGNFTSGAAGNLLIEQYDPYVQQNGGINTALPMTISGALTSSGGQTLSGNLANTGTITQGSTGTAITRINSGFCNVAAPATSIAASSTSKIDCGSGSNGGTALAGVTAGDMCFLSPATTTPATIAGLHLNGASASSTSGFITGVLANLTGTTYSFTAAATTSWQYLCIK